MDKQLLKAYIRTVVEEEVQRILPKLLSEAVSQVKNIKENTEPAFRRPVPERSMSYKNLLDMEIRGDTIVARTDNVVTPMQAPSDVDPAVFAKVTGDFSEHMKKLGLV